MALITASDIATTVFNDSQMDSLFTTSAIEAVEQRRIVDVITSDAYDAIIADMDEGGTYEVEGGHLQTALCYFVAADLIITIGTRAENRGIFNLNAETAQRAEQDGLYGLQLHYFHMANQFMVKALELIEAWTDYSDYDITFEAADFVSDMPQVDSTNLQQVFKI